MRKIILTGMCFLISLMPSSFAAEVVQTTTTTPGSSTTEVEYPWELSVQGNAVWTLKNKSRLHDAVYGAARLTYDIVPDVAIGVEGGWLGFRDKSNGVRYGRLGAIPALAELELKMPIPGTDRRIVPYAIGGAGAVFWNYDEDSSLDNLGVKVKNQTTFGAKGGVGVDFYVTRNVAIFVEGSYFYSRFKAKANISNPVEGRISAGSIFGGGGIKIAF